MLSVFVETPWVSQEVQAYVLQCFHSNAKEISFIRYYQMVKCKVSKVDD
uniref:Uncharacterized protein n=1 Tax=Nelumbo nucifera TaxID=4432 RepID=A0A822Y560_NELNU|nr:TPA_asm: hypothetical protein HUJ06_027643 [Nelumbo nucifera]